MKKSLRILALVFIAVSWSISGCALDETIDIPGGTGDNLQKYLGSWSVTDNGLKLNYEVTIDRNPNNSSMVLMRNFAGSGSAASALIVGNSIIVEGQVIGQNWTVSGNGSYQSETRLTMNYSLEIGGNQEERSAVFTR